MQACPCSKIYLALESGGARYTHVATNVLRTVNGACGRAWVRPSFAADLDLTPEGGRITLPMLRRGPRS